MSAPGDCAKSVRPHAFGAAMLTVAILAGVLAGVGDGTLEVHV
jgi:hypothetical protein